MAAPETTTGPINLGNPVETSIAELADRVIKLTGSRSKIVRRPLPVDDPVQRCPDITEAGRILGWRPETPLADGLTRTITYFERLLSENQALGRAGQ
jgi:UDP-glucuronate decarboxylase